MVYGNLSSVQPEVDHRSLVTYNKSAVSSGKLVKEISSAAAGLYYTRKLKGDFEVPAMKDLTEAQKAINTYLADMSKGKVLLVP
jgi:hypothetical protein